MTRENTYDPSPGTLKVVPGSSIVLILIALFFSIVRELTGHGVGQSLHEEPVIPNFVVKGPDPLISPGMVLAIEPMVNIGTYHVKTASNGWTISTKDGTLSCHYEDTIAILEKGNLNLTRVVES